METKLELTTSGARRIGWGIGFRWTEYLNPPWNFHYKIKNASIPKLPFFYAPLCSLEANQVMPDAFLVKSYHSCVWWSCTWDSLSSDGLGTPCSSFITGPTRFYGKVNPKLTRGFRCFQKIGVPQNGWFIMKNPIKMDDLGVSLVLETPI